MTKYTSPSRKLVLLLESKYKHFVSLLIQRSFHAIKHLPDKENLIRLVWKRCVILLLMAKKFPKLKESIISTLESLQKNNWMIFLDKLNTSDVQNQSILHIHLFQTLGLELTLKEKASQPFWTPVYNQLSEKLLSPIEIDLVDLGLTSSNLSSPKVEEKLPFWTMKETKVQNKSFQKTYYQLSTSLVVDKWEKEVTKQSVTKALKIRLRPSLKQRKIIDDWIDTSNYVYNKTVEAIREGHAINFITLRDKLVTKNTKKKHTDYISLSNEIAEVRNAKNELEKQKLETNIEKIKELNALIKAKNDELRNRAKTLDAVQNTDIKEWEYKTPKEVRAGAVNDVCKAYKTGFSNLKAGNINHFRLEYRKHYNKDKSVFIPKNFIKVVDGEISIAPEFFSRQHCKFEMGKKTRKKHKSLEIKHDSRIIKKKGEYWIVIPIDVAVIKKAKTVNYCGIDPGVRTFMTSFGNNNCIEYHHNTKILEELNKKLQFLKSLRTRPRQRKHRNRYRKASLNKIESRKSNLVDDTHWKTIKHILNHNDFIFYGDIKSHDIVKHGVNRTLNKNFNDLKFYKFKERLLYKATVKNKKVFCINEAYTTQTCSFCGCMYKPGCSKVYSCSNCKRHIDRDVNASKNILMKGIVTCL